MPLGINNNAQYNAFVNFATQATSSKSIARVADATDPLGTREIQVQSRDRVGALFRRGDVQRQNNATRTQFKNAIIAMFGGEEKIPQSVKDAMKFDLDFDKGKPLTARRIMAVKTAIDSLESRLTTAMQSAREATNSLYDVIPQGKIHWSDGSDVTQAELDTLLRDVLLHCIDDPVALDLVSKNMDKILVRGDAKVRDLDSALQQVDKLLGNISEIRAVAKKNQLVFKAGIDCLKALGGKPLPEGLFRSMVQIAGTCKVDCIKAIKANSSPLVIHKGVQQLMLNNLKIMSESQAERKLEGADERECANNMVTALLLARCSDAGVRAMKAALETESAQKLYSLYSGIGNGKFVNRELSLGVQSYTQAAGYVARNMLTQLKIMVEMRLGTPENAIQGVDMYDGKLNLAEFNGADIFWSIIDYGKIEMDRQREDYIQKTIKGEGQTAEKMRAIVGEALGPEPPPPSSTMQTRFEGNVASLVNLHLATECKLLAMGRFAESKFAQSCGSGITMKLGDQPLSSDPATARDQVVNFVTKGQTKTYAELNDPKMKNRVHLAMALLSKGVIEANEQGQARTLDPNQINTVIRPESNPADDQRNLTLLITSNDELKIVYQGTQKLTGLETRDANGQFVRNEIGPNSTLNSDLTYTIKQAALQRLETLDFTQFDDAGPQAVLDDDKPKKSSRLYTSLQAFKANDVIDYSCFTHITAQLN